MGAPGEDGQNDNSGYSDHEQSFHFTGRHDGLPINASQRSLLRYGKLTLKNKPSIDVICSQMASGPYFPRPNTHDLSDVGSEYLPVADAIGLHCKAIIYLSVRAKRRYTQVRHSLWQAQ
jgi:hypothetical protein